MLRLILEITTFFRAKGIAAIFGFLCFACACSPGDKSPAVEQVAKAGATAEAVLAHPEEAKKMAVKVMMGTPAPEPQKVYQLDPEYIEDMKPSPQMTEALSKYSPDFVMWKMEDYPPEKIKYYPYSDKSLPYAVKGDFNGDGIEDMAVAGHDKDSNLVLAILSDEKGYQVLPIRDGKYYADSRKYGKEIPYTATDVIAKKEKGYRFSYGDMSVTSVKMRSGGFSWKGIAYYDRNKTHTLKPGCEGIDPYEYTDKFIYQGEIYSSSGAVLSPGTPPAVTNVELSSPMEKALKEYNENFVLWKLSDYPKDKIKDYPYSEKAMPYAVKGDFNGDGREDIALLGHDADTNIAVALVSSSDSYHAVEIQSSSIYKKGRGQGKELPFTPINTLTIQEKGRKCIAGYNKRDTVLKTDGVRMKYIDTLAPVDKNDDYCDEYELTGLPGPEVLYEYSQKFFSYPGDEDGCFGPYKEMRF